MGKENISKKVLSFLKLLIYLFLKTKFEINIFLFKCYKFRI